MKPVELAFAIVLFTLGTTRAASAFEYIERYAFLTTATNDVAVLDTKADTVRAMLHFEKRPRSLIIIDDQKLLLSIPIDGRSIETFDLAHEAPEQPINVGHSVDLVQYAAKRNTLAVGSIDDGIVSFIDLSSRDIRARVFGVKGLTSILFDRSGENLFLTRKSSPLVSEVNVDAAKITNTVSALTVVGQGGSAGLRSLDKTPSGRFALALPEGPGPGIAVVDLSDMKVAKDIRLTGGRPDRAYSTSDGTFMLASSDSSGSISMVSMASLSEVASLRGGQHVTNISMAWFDTTAFAVDRAESNIVVIDLVSRDVASVLRLPGQPGNSATSPDGLKVYVPLPDTRAIAVVDARRREIVKLIDRLDFSPQGIFMAGAPAFCH